MSLDGGKLTAPDNIEAHFTSLTPDAIAVIQSIAGAAFFDIRDFGAAVDGSTDDALAVAAATNAAIAAGGGTVLFPRGVTRVATKYQCIPPGTAVDVTYQGVGGSEIELYQIANDRGISLSGYGILTFRDLIIRGETAGGVSADELECSPGAPIVIEDTFKTVFERFKLLGIASGNNAVLYTNLTKLVMKNGIIAACRASGSHGTVDLERSFGCDFENVFFPDYQQNDYEFYNKFGFGNNQTWIKAYNPVTVDNAKHGPLYRFAGCGFDENNQVGLINLTGSDRHTVEIDGCEFATGFGGLGAADAGLVFDTFQEVCIRNTNVGYKDNDVEHRAGRFTDVRTVRLQNYRQTDGATWITLDGVTELVKQGFCDLQGTATFPTGVEDLGAATTTVYK